MTFSRANPLGWALFEELTSAQMNIIDLNQSRAIDGVDGGVYNLGGPLTINGTVNISNLVATVTTGDDLVLDNLTVNVNADIEDLNVFGSALFDSSSDLSVDSVATNFTGVSVLFTGGQVSFASGTLVNVQTNIQFLSGADIDFLNGSATVVSSAATWTFQNVPTFTSGFTNLGTSTFIGLPFFDAGIELDAGELVYYDAAVQWDVRIPFALGGKPGQDVFTYYEWGHATNCWRQINNSAWPVYLYSLPQGLLGDTAVTIVDASVRVHAANLSGTPTGTTEFTMWVADQDMSRTTRTITDASPNSTAHDADWAGPNLGYDPATQTLGCVFLGYRGGDTLASPSKYYEPRTLKLTLSTTAKGVY